MQPDAVSTLLRPIDVALADLRATLTTPPVIAPAAPLPRVEARQIAYTRTFRLPRASSNGVTFEFNGGPLALDPRTGTLFVTSRDGEIAEVTIPAPALVDPFTPVYPFASYVQGLMDPSEGAIRAAFGAAAGLSGLLVLDDGRLMGNALSYYDGNGAQRVSHFIRPRDLSDRGHVSPLVNVGQPAMTGYVAGYMARVPLEWRVALKGTAISGTFGSPIVSRGSEGPAAFAFVPDVTPMPATSLVYYPGDHPTLGVYGEAAPNAVYSMTAKGDGLVLVDGTCSALFFGRNGLGPQTYGAGTGDPARVGTIESGSDRYSFDPANSNKGPHAYPYRYQVWAYDCYELAAVAAGLKKPWDVLPYGVWPLELPTIDPAFTGFGGAAYDPGTRTLYLEQLRADVDGYASRAYVHVLTIAP